jgi:hypothetical protein
LKERLNWNYLKDSVYVKSGEREREGIFNPKPEMEMGLL